MDATTSTTPPTENDTRPMDRAELRVVLRGLGLGVPAAGRALRVDPRTVRFWLAGDYAVPDGVRDEIEAIETRTAVLVGDLVDAANDQADPTLVTYRDDEALWAARPETHPLPAAWWDTVVWRAALEVPGVVITYPARGAS